MVQVAVAVMPLVTRAVVEVVQLVTAPVTDHVTVPVGAAPPVEPVTVAVKVMLEPRVVGEEFETTFEAGAALATTTVVLPAVVSVSE
jgi:hypothetical protein